MRTAITLLCGACALLAGCTVGPDFQRPTAALPASWTGDGAVAPAGASAAVPASSTTAAHDAGGAEAPVASRPVPGPLDVDWWRQFGDPELSSLIERASAGNLDVEAAGARVAAARAARRVTGAEALPALNGSAAYQHARSSQNGLIDVSGLNGKSDYNLWQPGLDVSWELDLWGRVRRRIEAADASLQAAEDWRRAVLLSMLAETAGSYVRLRGVQAQQDIVRRNLDTARDNARLTRIRLRDGVATQLDLAEADAQVKTIEARLPPLDHERARLVNALSLLLGAPPRTLEAELRQAAPLPPVPPAVPVGLPSELAERRPDIREAEATLHAATAQIGVAVGDFYPRVTLSANLDLQAMHFGDLDSWSSRAFGVGPAISIPLFEGGRLKGQLALRNAEQQAAAIGYRRTVLNAWHEVDDAMSAYRTSQQQHDTLAEAVEQNRLALDNARRQYLAGATDFLNVLTVQQNLLGTQQALAVSRTDVLVSLIGLFKALGGGWQTTFPAADAQAGAAGMPAAASGVGANAGSRAGTAATGGAPAPRAG
ncbi:efflux transporter outer membrane subunit [Burkholderia perseverans]|uniref:efflux transporter outer membrane subunit n=1 Tax=Burkholderia perseverans TaxID=2615214 RepID=UPI001FEF5CF3|nr:efflux transporter outer membrane subunit [Burkholderia perseverans]